MHNILYIEDTIDNTNYDTAARMKEVLQRENKCQKIEANDGYVNRNFYGSAACAERYWSHSEYVLTKAYRGMTHNYLRQLFF